MIKSTPILTRNNFRKLEAWAMSLALGFFLFALLIETRREHNYTPWQFEEYQIQYNYLENFFLPAIFEAIIAYAALMVLILIVEPFWERERSINKTAAFIVGICLVAALCFAVADTYLDAYILGKYTSLEHAYKRIFFDAFVKIAIAALLYIAYYLAKYLIRQLINSINWKLPSSKNIAVRILAGFVGYILLAIFFAAANMNSIVVLWLVMVPYSVLIVLLNVLWLIPSSAVKSYFNTSYIVKMITISIPLALLALALMASGMYRVKDEVAVVMFLFILLWTAVALLPWSWYLYKQSADKTVLVNALGKSDANLSFLKSQINPHFLFNALNTLYGTALQEKAERTGEGIQKLGDMMRFMLQENVQDKISLTRDVDYLNNYIDLQKLRTSRTADIIIETKIDEQLNNLEIAPMLLIPFVENAFKHGISLQEASHIKVTLQTKEHKLYFDVHNSIHIKADNDPEKLKSGIGLTNVKQRLALLYPNKHELIIRESAREFFIHLTLELS